MMLNEVPNIQKLIEAIYITYIIVIFNACKLWQMCLVCWVSFVVLHAQTHTRLKTKTTFNSFGKMFLFPSKDNVLGLLVRVGLLEIKMCCWFFFFVFLFRLFMLFENEKQKKKNVEN